MLFKTRRLNHVNIFIQWAIKKALMISTQWSSHLWVIAKVRITQIVTGLTIGENVSLKLKSNCWSNPLATSRAFYLFTEPSGFFLTLKIHLHPTCFRFGGKVVGVQVWFLNKDSYSSLMASSQYGLEKACLTIKFSMWERRVVGLEWLILAWVNMG